VAVAAGGIPSLADVAELHRGGVPPEVIDTFEVNVVLADRGISAQGQLQLMWRLDSGRGVVRKTAWPVLVFLPGST